MRIEHIAHRNKSLMELGYRCAHIFLVYKCNLTHPIQSLSFGFDFLFGWQENHMKNRWLWLFVAGFLCGRCAMTRPKKRKLHFSISVHPQSSVCTLFPIAFHIFVVFHLNLCRPWSHVIEKMRSKTGYGHSNLVVYRQTFSSAITFINVSRCYSCLSIIHLYGQVLSAHRGAFTLSQGAIYRKIGEVQRHIPNSVRLARTRWNTIYDKFFTSLLSLPPPQHVDPFWRCINQLIALKNA